MLRVKMMRTTSAIALGMAALAATPAHADECQTNNVGNTSTSSGFASLACGTSADAVGDYSTAIGAYANADGTSATAVGALASATGN